MTTPPDPSQALVPLSRNEGADSAAAFIASNEAGKAETGLALPDIVRRAGQAAVFAAEEFFYGAIRNDHTRIAYRRAVDRFLAWCERRGLDLPRIAPRDVGQYLDGLRKELGIASRKQHLAAIRHFFDGMVTRHAIILNPALSVRGDRYTVVEGITPEISIQNARDLFKSIKVAETIKRPDGAKEERPCVKGLRDRAMLAILAYTASRAGAVAKLRRGDFIEDGTQWVLRFEEKRGKSREIPVRHDLQEMIAAYIAAAGLQDAPRDAPLFRAAIGRTGQLADTAIHVNDICRMMKRRLKDASLPRRLSPHSFRVAVITDLLQQGIPLDEVQHLAGHADPRTTRLYDRRQKKVTRNIVERISI